VPILTYFYKLWINAARAISLAILLPPVSIGAVYKYWILEWDINWEIAIILLVSYMILNWLWVKMWNKTKSKYLKMIMWIILILIGFMSLI
jgi:uncharacterized membrane protein YfcA